ncbi:uncharacterized protein ATNIH1004_007447 [Aspergillus tanneri]|uniref:Azaphilone pigments biosynthesis cluster protein L N-terminal domain-containing protein n=1 Tax=Aspergillus tanneri TaxID=1220188 RepID=A0A5M9MGD4_9EURO|nr:uncharacterized protein ATNIH1004_007447 [Aspergillus tanneri]KAA8646025.1 hypothetical protein ATNIH1004_007447 [Aspergillus tanneri]
MAEALSLASSLVALAGFAFQTSKSLYQVIESFKTTKRTVRELRYELDSLTQALATLQQAAANNEDQLVALKLPLLRCGKICKEFEEVINSCISHSHGQRASFRDWAKLQYMGGDIENIRITLAGYKATINIALGGATFRQANVTANVLDEYRQMIAEATSDLQDHLQGINERVESLEQKGPVQDSDADLSVIMEEKESTEQCLAICSQVSRFIEAAQKRLPRGSHTDRTLSLESAWNKASDLTGKARTNVFEDVTSSDDSHQLVVSTIGDLISARHIITGARSMQWLGQMSDDTLQQLSRSQKNISREQEDLGV